MILYQLAFIYSYMYMYVEKACDCDLAALESLYQCLSIGVKAYNQLNTFLHCT